MVKTKYIGATKKFLSSNFTLPVTLTFSVFGHSKIKHTPTSRNHFLHTNRHLIAHAHIGQGGENVQSLHQIERKTDQKEILKPESCYFANILKTFI
jgi:hypothetical protein